MAGHPCKASQYPNKNMAFFAKAMPSRNSPPRVWGRPVPLPLRRSLPVSQRPEDGVENVVELFADILG